LGVDELDNGAGAHFIAEKFYLVLLLRGAQILVGKLQGFFGILHVVPVVGDLTDRLVAHDAQARFCLFHGGARFFDFVGNIKPLKNRHF